ncbi:MAG: HlyD family secretion protein [Nitrospirae bacterium]|nr:HlyD family secretion protein [Nitrospirota bacterium]
MEETKKEIPGNNRKKKIAITIFSVVLIAGALTGYFYVQYKKTHITTDDAFITGRIHTIASKVSGTAKNIYIKDNQTVKQGELLVEIDQADFGLRQKEASSGLEAEKSKLIELKSKLDTARQQFEELKSAVGAAKANLELQDANKKQAEADMKRAENLFKGDLISEERFEKTKTGYDVVLAQVKAVKEEVKQTESRLETQKAIIRQAYAAIEPQKALIIQKEASLAATELNLSYTKISAPTDGYITRKSVETGNQIQTGQPLMAVVSLYDIWIIANYKETQLERVKPGQKVEIEIDSYPGKKFTGKVESIMAGTGSVFSLFPPENATGNFVKVVQRIPVKIVLDKNTDSEHVLRIGMSVVPTVLIQE